MGRADRLAPQSLRLRALLGVLFVGIAALPLTYVALGRKPPMPAPGASQEVQRTYWRGRIQANIADTDAYLQLGILDEREGYNTAAVKHLMAARALGAADKEVCGPLGRALTHLARDDEALPELEKAAALAPDSVEATANLAGLFVNAGQPAEATARLRRFADAHATLPPDDARHLSLCFMEAGESAAAREWAEKALTQAPDDLISHSVAARCALNGKDLPAARLHLEAILKAAPNDIGALYLHGLALAQEGQKEDALHEWQKAVAINSNAPDVFERIGDYYREKSDFGHASVAYETLARLAPTGLTARRAAVALAKAGKGDRAAYWAAVALGFAGEFPAALHEAQKAVGSPDPTIHRMGLQAMAESYRGMRQREPYLATMRQLTAEKTADNLILMARAWSELDNHEKRAECLREALTLATPQQRPGILYDLAVLYQVRGMYADAVRTIDEAVAADPKNPEHYREMAEIYYARRSEPGRLEKAIDAWKTAISLDPETASDWQHLGVAYLGAGNPLEAVRYLEHAVDLEPGSGPAYKELSRAYQELGDIPTADRMMGLYKRYVTFEQQRQTLRTRARRENATVADLVAYGDMAVRMEDYDEAAHQYERALKQKPDDATLRKKLASVYGHLRMTDFRKEVEAPPAASPTPDAKR